MALDRTPATTRPRAAALAVSALLLVLAPVASAATGGSAEVDSAASPGWVPPLDRAPDALGVLAPFDPPLQDWLPGHRGVDLAAAAGEPVLAPAPGVVTFAGPVAGRGVVVVTHDDGLRTSLEPVTASAPRGTRVAAGDVVGTVQVPDGVAVASHCADTCVHWGVRRGDRYVDPLAMLGERPPIVLLPLGEP
ncbi:M23 family metallopeptidase [Cellulosimicrobium cellulans]|uniref:M23 family metallopeptidase n=1 Tax=Cellulosimicrobium cellulans TaxID=1710 RepID=UPI0019635F88|nr:M23 family metallopeptidase [Cellulosimicrobium cellulans]MBN0041427.1 M23 family metallopeptidase [Cellulosimicrobium cellulans]